MLLFLCDPLDGDNEEEHRNDDNQDNNDLPEHDDDGVDDRDDDDDDDDDHLSRHIWVRPRHGHARPLGCTARPNTVALRMIKIVNTKALYVIDAIRTEYNCKGFESSL